jgi:hypothetical protein
VIVSDSLLRNAIHISAEPALALLENANLLAIHAKFDEMRKRAQVRSVPQRAASAMAPNETALKRQRLSNLGM